MIDNPKGKKNLMFKELEDGGVIYEPEEEKCHSLNSTAAYIWSLCDGNHSITDILNMAKEDFITFKVNPKENINDIIKQFRELDLLE